MVYGSNIIQEGTNRARKCRMAQNDLMEDIALNGT